MTEKANNHLVWIVPLVVSLLAAYGVVSNELIKDGESRMAVLEYKVVALEKDIKELRDAIDCGR